MIKLSALYPNNEGATFDMDYYCQKHIPMVRQLLGSACINASVEKGIAGLIPGAKADYIVIGQLYFENLEGFSSSFVRHANAIIADVPNFTTTTPIAQISE